MLIFNTEKTHSTRLYALLMSSLRAINPDFPFLLFLRLWSVSKMTSILSEINLSDIKTLCDFETNLDKIFLRRLQWFWKLFYIGVAKVYGSKVFDFFWRFYLWNEWDVSVVERFGQWIRIEREREREREAAIIFWPIKKVRDPRTLKPVQFEEVIGSHVSRDMWGINIKQPIKALNKKRKY